MRASNVFLYIRGSVHSAPVLPFTSASGVLLIRILLELNAILDLLTTELYIKKCAGFVIATWLVLAKIKCVILEFKASTH